MKLIFTTLTTLIVGTTMSHAALTLLFGDDPNELGGIGAPAAPTLTASVNGDGTDAFTTGALTVAGITFDLMISRTTAGNISFSNNAIGPNITDGGNALVFTLSNITGLAPTEQLVFSNLVTQFATADDGINGEGVVFNGTAVEIPVAAGGNTFAVPGFTPTANTLTVAGQDFGVQDTSFQIRSLEFDVVTIPEPSAMALFILGGFGLLIRKRR